jgi:hypothetical protein
MRRKLVKTAAIAATALAVAVAGAETASASTPTSGYAYVAGIQLMVRPLAVAGRTVTVATWCNDRSTSASIHVGLFDAQTDSWLPMEDVNSGWTTYPTGINFNPGACESFMLYTPQTNGDTVAAYIDSVSEVAVTAVVPG